MGDELGGLSAPARVRISELEAELAAVEQERDTIKAALVSECEVAQNTARFVRRERERAEAAEQERDRALHEWDQARDALTATINERDRALDKLARLDTMHAAVCKRATRLAALEAAARAWADNWFLTDDGVVDLECNLRDAVAALDADVGSTRDEQQTSGPGSERA